MEKNEQEADLRKSERMRLLLLVVFKFELPFGTQVEGGWIYEFRGQEERSGSEI